MELNQLLHLAARTYESRESRTAKSHCRRVIAAACDIINLPMDHKENILTAFDWDGVKVEMIKVSLARQILGLNENQWYHRIKNPDIYPDFAELHIHKENQTLSIVPKREILELAIKRERERGLID